MMKPMLDVDAIETQEWLDALASVLKHEGPERVQYLLEILSTEARQAGLDLPSGRNTAYTNTISPSAEKPLPDDEGNARRIAVLIRWNAVAMVLRAGKKAPELGGHLATYASASTLYEVGFNHFFHAPTPDHGGDLLYIQGHSSPGIYARAFLEGRLSENQLEHFRQEVETEGLSSYPHPWLMQDFWQFPTVSMGLGPLQAIYQARFLKYLEHRGLAKTEPRKVWAFLGDGETDEPESLGAISLAARENLDNLIFVVNCNLQRLDGPVRGNSKIIQELEAVFRGAGWHVIKVLWGSNWDPLLAADTDGRLQKRMAECVDGEYQSYKARDGAYVRAHFFGADPILKERVAHMTDDEIWKLRRGGHDPRKVYAAYHQAVNHKGQPVVILAKTVKGYGMGSAGEGMNITHQQKKMGPEDLMAFRDRFNIPIPDNLIDKVPFFKPAADSPEMQYLKKSREKLGGSLPARSRGTKTLAVPPLEVFSALLESSGEREISTTMALVRILNSLLRDKALGKFVVPIVPDECRTFGMEGMFRQYGIYSSLGQLYTPEDADQVMYYREARDGQILEEGINEAGAFCSWMAAATSYSTNDLPMIPFYIYYSMFGFQRIGDLAWAAGDMRARGFLVGGTAGRTTLAGEGLQHQDGHSHILSGTIPNCVSYDPCFAYELAVIVHKGLERMLVNQESVYFYLTVMNENYHHPAMPKGVEEGIVKGLYCFQAAAKPAKLHVRLLGSGAILREVIQAANLLADEFKVSSDIWSVTSFNELRREALDLEREHLLNPSDKKPVPYVQQCLQGSSTPVIAATDYMRSYADQVRQWVPAPYLTLGTDGFGRSDTRAQLRHFFEVDAKHIAYASLKALADNGQFSVADLLKAQQKLGINPKKSNPLKD
jgi:pyruvate dehydrogenase E1 component